MSTERARLAANGITPRKRLGQNFLLDPRIPELIAERASWPESAPVVEIGAGSGALTTALLTAGHRVVSIEVDPDLARLLRGRFQAEREQGSWSLIEEDVLALAFASPPLSDELGRVTSGDPASKPWLAGNLPYGITTPILEWSCRARAVFAGAVFMVQREYGDRLLASPGGREIGSLTHWIGAQARVRPILRVGRSSFWPRPGVESVVLELTFPVPPPFEGDLAALERILRAAFGQRRKTLANSLAHGLALPKDGVIARLQALAVDPAARAETLVLGDFARMAEAFAPLSSAP